LSEFPSRYLEPLERIRQSIYAFAMELAPLLLNSITDVDASARGRIVLSGSHGGLYPAAIASHAGVRAVVFNDAGIGFEQAGVAGIRALGRCGMAAAAVDCMSSEIGVAIDMRTHGVISFANEVALAIGVRVGMYVFDALALLDGAAEPHGQMGPVTEARWDEELGPETEPLLCVDSASLIKTEDAGRVIVTGSHGGLIGGDPSRALKARARLVIFNDAGGGKNGAGTSRLPVLQKQGLAAVMVAHDSCRIGDAASALSSGVISALNPSAAAMGLRLQCRLAEALRALS